MNKLLTISVA